MIHDAELRPAHISAPGEILKMELNARGWTQYEFAQIIGKPPQAISEIINRKKRITPETALRIAAALGTSPELWNNLEAEYQLYLARQHTPNQELSAIEQRSQQKNQLQIPV